MNSKGKIEEKREAERPPVTLRSRRRLGTGSGAATLGASGTDPTALAAACLERGWWVVPVDTATGEVALPDGIGGASRDPETVLKWASDPKLKIGIVTGRDFGIVAIRFAKILGTRLSAKLPGHPPLPATLEVNSAHGFGGNHLLFSAPQVDLPCRKIAKGIHFFGEGGVIIPLGAIRGTAIAPFPESLSSLISGKSPVGTEGGASAGAFPASDRATAHEAAKAYAALGLKLVPVDSNGNRVGKAEISCAPELWEKHPSMGMGIRTGLDSGIVALSFADQSIFEKFKQKHEQFCSFVVAGQHPTVFFRAPGERFPSQDITPQIRYIGEDDFFPAPPSTINGVELEWIAKGLSELRIPEFLPTLRDLLVRRCAANAVHRSNPNSPPKPAKATGGHTAHLLGAKRAEPQRPHTVRPVTTRGAATAQKASKAATIEEEALFDAWLAECTDRGKKFSDAANALNKNFSIFAGKEVSPQRFGRLLRAKGFKSTKSSVMRYEGLRLKERPK